VGIGAVLFLRGEFKLDTESLVIVTVFNLFFVITTFALDGSLAVKLLMLLVGDAVFLILNGGMSYVFGLAGNSMGQDSINVLLNSLVGLIWMVSFWSVSLSVLSKSRPSHRR